MNVLRKNSVQKMVICSRDCNPYMLNRWGLFSQVEPTRICIWNAVVMETSYCHVDRPVGTAVGINRRSEDRMFSFIPDRVPAWGSLYPSIVMEELGRDHFRSHNNWTRGGQTCEWVSSPVLAKLVKIGPLEEQVKEICEACTKAFLFFLSFLQADLLPIPQSDMYSL